MQRKHLVSILKRKQHTVNLEKSLEENIEKQMTETDDRSHRYDDEGK